MTTLFGPSNASNTPVGMINRLYNGDFTYNPAGTVVVADGVAVFDNWYVLTQSGTITSSQVTYPEPGQYACGRFEQSSATAQRYGVAQEVDPEDCGDLRTALMNATARLRFSEDANLRWAVLASVTSTQDVVNDWTSASYIPGQFFISSVDVINQGIFRADAGTFASLPQIPYQGTDDLVYLYFFVWTQDTVAQGGTLDVGLCQLAEGVVTQPYEHRPFLLTEAAGFQPSAAWETVILSPTIGQGQALIDVGQPFTDIASAATTTLANVNSNKVRITGTTTITSFGSASAGLYKTIRFAGALTLTHNGTSLILPAGGANIATAANDCAVAASLGSGNWIVVDYQRASGGAITSAGVSVENYSAMQAIPVGSTEYIYVRGRATESDGGEGSFVWRSGDQSANVAADPIKGVWVAPASASTGASGAWQRQSQNLGVFLPEWYGAVHDGATDDSTAIQAAIDACAAAGKGELRFGPFTYAISTGLTVADSFIGVVGVPGVTRLTLTSSATAIEMLAIAGSFSAPTTMASNASENAIAVTVTSAAAFSVGSYVELTTTLASPGVYAEAIFCPVTAKSGSTLTLSVPLPFAMLTANTNGVYPISPLDGIYVRGITFDRGLNTGDPTHGLTLRYLINSSVENISFDGFQTGSGVLADVCYNCSFRDIAGTDSGSAGYSDAYFLTTTACTFQDIRSTVAYGFGPQWVRGHYGAVTNVTSDKAGSGLPATGRGIKLTTCSRMSFTNLVANNSHSTGLSVSVYTRFCQFHGVNASANGVENGSANGIGIWFSDQHNTDNVINGVYAIANNTADIAVYTTDVQNILCGTYYGTLINLGNAVVEFIGVSGGVTYTIGSALLQSDDAGASAGPFLYLYRNSSSAAASDNLGSLNFPGKDAAGNDTTYAQIYGRLLDPTNGSEDGAVWIDVIAGGSTTNVARIGPGLVLGAATGGDQGLGTANFAADIYKNGVAFTNPRWALQHFYTGAADTGGPYAPPINYTGLMSLDEVREFTRRENELPLMLELPSGGAFARGDLMLATLEQAYLHIMELHERLKKLESAQGQTP